MMRVIFLDFLPVIGQEFQIYECGEPTIYEVIAVSNQSIAFYTEKGGVFSAPVVPRLIPRQVYKIKLEKRSQETLKG